MQNKDKIILHLCADIGSDTMPYVEAGYTVIRVGKDIGVENYTAPDNVYGVIANPPCTMFSIARTNAKTPRNIEEGLFTIKHCLRIIWEIQSKMIAKHVPYKLKFWALENPYTGYLKNYLGEPYYVYQPYKFGEDYTKATALWGRFNKPKETTPNAIAPKHYSMSDKINPMNCRNEEERMHLRSMCSPNFAKAFFKANK